MWKLLIADDEAIIRNGLKNALKWEEYGIECVGEAEDGEVALKMCQDKKPDILLLDICMPFLSGIELLAQLGEQALSMKVIVISGHDEFEYAKESLRLGVMDYLLKPIDEDELESVIKKAVYLLMQNQENEKINDAKSKALMQHKQLVKQAYLKKILLGTMKPEIELNELHDLRESYTGMLVVSINPYGDIDRNPLVRDSNLMWFAIGNIGQESIEPYQGHCIHMEHNILAFIGAFESGESLGDFLYEIRERYEQLLNMGCYGIYEDISMEVSDLPIIYDKLVARLNQDMSYSPIIYKIIQYVGKNYHHTGLSLEQTSQVMGMNANYLSRLMKDEMGIGFNEYVNKVRIDVSKQLLKAPEMKIYEVAEKTGYTSQHYFSKTFKKIVGLSPKRYQQDGSLL